MSGKYGFGEPFIDVDEWRDSPRRHRYMHGGFADTHTRFSFYFPPEPEYAGRFFQYLEGGAGGHESLLAAGGYPGMGFDWIFDVAFEELGGYLVESNQGHFHNEGTGFANEVELFGASAESARYAKVLAEEMYGSPPHHGYVWGGSGGGSRSIYCLENEQEVYDGASPHVSPAAGWASSGRPSDTGGCTPGTALATSSMQCPPAAVATPSRLLRTTSGRRSPRAIGTGTRGGPRASSGASPPGSGPWHWRTAIPTTTISGTPPVT